MFDVVGVGDLDVDLYMDLDRIPEPDEKLLARNHHYHVGGMVANTCAALSRLGKSTILHAPVGDDYYGNVALAGMKQSGVDVSGVIKKPVGSTYFCVVMLDPSGEKALIVVPTDCLHPAEEDICADVIKGARHMHTVLFDGVESALEIARENRITVSLDIEPGMVQGQSIDRLREILQKVDIVFIGETAADLVGSTGSPRENIEKIAGFGSGIICLTQGSRGGLVWHEGNVERYQAFPVKPLDTTGAGDCFDSGFIYGFLEGWPPLRSAEFASAAAALNTLSYGGHDGAPSFDEVIRMIQNNRD